MKLLFDNSDQHVSGDSAPDLRLHRVLAVADETFDAQMLLDPLEEQFDLPAAFVERGDSQCGQGGIVGQEHQRLAGLRIFETDAPQLLGIILRDVVSIQDDALIADDACASVCRTRIHSVRIHASLGSSHEECSSLMQREQTTEVQVAAIHHVERSGLEGQHIQHVDLVGLAVRDMNEGWNVAAQIEQRMKFDCCLGGTKRRPWKQRQTQVDGRGIQGIHRIGKLYSKAVVAVEFAGTSDEQRCQIRPDMPVATFVGIGQRGVSIKILRSVKSNWHANSIHKTAFLWS